MKKRFLGGVVATVLGAWIVPGGSLDRHLEGCFQMDRIRPGDCWLLSGTPCGSTERVLRKDGMDHPPISHRMTMSRTDQLVGGELREKHEDFAHSTGCVYKYFC